MNNHRETITGTTVQGEMGREGGKENVVGQKTGGKTHRERKGASGQRSELLGAGAAWASE